MESNWTRNNESECSTSSCQVCCSCIRWDMIDQNFYMKSCYTVHIETKHWSMSTPILLSVTRPKMSEENMNFFQLKTNDQSIRTSYVSNTFDESSSYRDRSKISRRQFTNSSKTNLWQNVSEISNDNLRSIMFKEISKFLVIENIW